MCVRVVRVALLIVYILLVRVHRNERDNEQQYGNVDVNWGTQRNQNGLK